MSRARQRVRKLQNERTLLRNRVARYASLEAARTGEPIQSIIERAFPEAWELYEEAKNA